MTERRVSPTDGTNPVIQLTRLRHGETFFLNPDLFERVDTYVDTVIHLTDGTEYLVIEPAEEIIRKIVEFRARIIAIAAVLQANAFGNEPGSPEHATNRLAGELVTASAPTDHEPAHVEEPQ